MADVYTPSRVGEIRHVPFDHFMRGSNGCWWLIVSISRGVPFGAYLMGNPINGKAIGDVVDVSMCDVVPDDQVPSEIEALAMAHLLLSGNNNGPR